MVIKEIQVNKENLNKEISGEAQILYKCDHENIVKLIRIISEITQIKFYILEYVNMGDLRTYLLSIRSNWNFR